MERIDKMVEDLGLNFEYEAYDPRYDERRKTEYANAFFRRRQRKGTTWADAARLLKSRPYFAAQMVIPGMPTGLLGASVGTTPMC